MRDKAEVASFATYLAIALGVFAFSYLAALGDPLGCTVFVPGLVQTWAYTQALLVGKTAAALAPGRDPFWSSMITWAALYVTTAVSGWLIIEKVFAVKLWSVAARAAVFWAGVVLAYSHAAFLLVMLGYLHD